MASLPFEMTLGMRLITDVNLIDMNKPEWVIDRKKRTWKQRLFSLPWRPFQKIKKVHRIVFRQPLSGAIIDKNNNICIMHPVTLQKLEEALAQEAAEQICTEPIEFSMWNRFGFGLHPYPHHSGISNLFLS